jgi:hypothetical protein
MRSVSTCPKSIADPVAVSAHLELRCAGVMRDALAEVAETGWDSPAGERLLASLREASTTVTARVERGRHIVRDPARCDDLLSHAWELVEGHRDELLHADNPWAYLATCLRHVLVGLTLADTLQVSPTVVRNGTAARLGIQPPLRIGTALVDNDEPWAAAPALPDPSDRSGWDSGLVALHAQLVERGAPPNISAAAINRIADIAATTRRATARPPPHTTPRYAD